MAEPLNLRGYPRWDRGEVNRTGAQPNSRRRPIISASSSPSPNTNPLAVFHLASGTHQCFPYVGADLPREGSLHCAAQMPRAVVRGAGRRKTPARLPRVSWNDTRIIQNDEFVAAKQAP